MSRFFGNMPKYILKKLLGNSNQKFPTSPSSHRKQLGVYCYAKQLVINILGIYTNFIKNSNIMNKNKLMYFCFSPQKNKKLGRARKPPTQKNLLFYANTL